MRYAALVDSSTGEFRVEQKSKKLYKNMLHVWKQQERFEDDTEAALAPTPSPPSPPKSWRMCGIVTPTGAAATRQSLM